MNMEPNINQAAATESQPLWVTEFGESFAVPSEIANHPKLEDVSFHNDECPIFRFSSRFGREYIVLVRHPDINVRTIKGPRFVISGIGFLFGFNELDRVLAKIAELSPQ